MKCPLTVWRAESVAKAPHATASILGVFFCEAWPCQTEKKGPATERERSGPQGDDEPIGGTAMAHDVLENLSSQQVAAWYGRLADFVSNQFKSKLGGQEPLSAQVLRHWLKNKGANFRFVAPTYLITNRYVVSEIQY